jgi:hypothetical protein
VLVVGTDDWAIEQAGASLEAAGQRVLRCHEPGQPAFPCNALRPEGVCPLDVGFDVVVTMRAHPVSPPAPGEFGVVCGIHAGAALLVGGLSHANPFLPWESAEVDVTEDLPTAVARAANSDSVDLRQPSR